MAMGTIRVAEISYVLLMVCFSSKSVSHKVFDEMSRPFKLKKRDAVFSTRIVVVEVST